MAVLRVRCRGGTDSLLPVGRRDVHAPALDRSLPLRESCPPGGDAGPAMTARRAPRPVAALPVRLASRTAMTALLPPFHGRDGLMSYSTENIRNVALAGHPGAGKTMLFEALLHAGGAIQTAGTIERGTTISDFDPIEKERGHSVDAAIASIDATTDGPLHLNVVDTPG